MNITARLCTRHPQGRGIKQPRYVFSHDKVIRINRVIRTGFFAVHWLGVELMIEWEKVLVRFDKCSRS